MPVYNKLVRDFIPKIIEKDGKTHTSKTLNEIDYKNALQEKLQEEIQEYKQATRDKEAIEELADMLEVIYALTELHNSSKEDLEAIREAKAEKRGGFSDKVFLIEVED